MFEQLYTNVMSRMLEPGRTKVVSTTAAQFFKIMVLYYIYGFNGAYTARCDCLLWKPFGSQFEWISNPK